MDVSSRIEELEQKFNENPRRFFAPLANEYRKAGDLERAIAICRAHLGQMPGHMSGQIVYGQALFENGEYDEARSVFETALAMDRENLIALRHLGDLALRSGDTALARQWYTRLLDVDPKDTTVIALVNEIDAAKEAGDSAAASKPVPMIDEDRGDQEIPQMTREPEPAPVVADEQYFTESSEPQMPVPQAFVTETMAELYLTQGFSDLALDVYRQLSEANPEDERLRSRAAELEQPGADHAVARREEPPSVESPAEQPDEHVERSIESPSAPTPSGEPPSEESPGTDTAPIDSPPTSEPPGESESVETPMREEPRAEPEGIAAVAEYSIDEEPVAASYDTAAESGEMPGAEEARVEPVSVTAAEEATIEPDLEEPGKAAPRVTVREFFAALGRIRPRPASTSATNGHGHGHSNVETISLGAPSAEDQRAATALAAAFSSSGEQLTEQREAATVADRGQSGKESEEDVASFRAWLDGLTSE